MDDGVTQYYTSLAYEGMTLNRKIWRSSIRTGRKGLVDLINRDVIQEHCPRAEGNEKWDRVIKERRSRRKALAQQNSVTYSS